MARTAEEVRKEIDAERERLATALDDLRGSVKSKVPIAAGAAAVLATARFLVRRRRR